MNSINQPVFSELWSNKPPPVNPLLKRSTKPVRERESNSRRLKKNMKRMLPRRKEKRLLKLRRNKMRPRMPLLKLPKILQPQRWCKPLTRLLLESTFQSSSKPFKPIFSKSLLKALPSLNCLPPLATKISLLSQILVPLQSLLRSWPSITLKLLLPQSPPQFKSLPKLLNQLMRKLPKRRLRNWLPN